MAEYELTEANLSVLYAEGRRWLADCNWLGAGELSDLLTVRSIDAIYDGGWKGFEFDHRALLSE